MRYFVILAILSCILALCHAAREVVLKNADGEEETYNSDDFFCHRVGRKFHSPENEAVATGGPVMYYSDSECRKRVNVDLDGEGESIHVASRIKAYRALDLECSANSGTSPLRKR
ncbi:hypothetical protein GGH91_001425 [Coemansia sp. RSA 2671]|uniref:Uncharacterized protein n=1 Tax=Coemansia linderi TaxID=2663919 RepID=A0ACC1KLF5_9FUNG|nr:hypothetical protein LPJ60_000046 [Coemansia sp. RSA 2675]KAJ2027018.1 hypothetical protein IWW57_002797 [Coemansia sp. S610]KAJ2348350.1 hypothetical protein GGH91_001425 [Coemansia sp. RSA 2671]KAJ2402902.1 hypothetical protein GGI10_005831 [Coemansia sp. RSA 2530]KAJ2699058.1 hypothetical protein H4218_002910 [Coemansia sp. IMI 209128]KAJ2791243.1 hypothetical protein GGI18_001276 [Coemansia linderi]